MRQNHSTKKILVKNWRRSLVLLWVMSLTLAALYLRLAYITHTHIDRPIRADAAEYIKYAMNLNKHGVFSRDTSSVSPRPDAYRTPGYPIILALIIQIFGEKYFYQHILIIQVILGALLVPLTYLLARFFLPIWASSLAAFLVCFSPHLVSIGSYILTESSFAFWLLLSLFLFFSAHHLDSLWLYILAGIGFGIAYLITPTVFFIPWLLVGVVTFARGYFNKRILTCGIVFILAFSITWVGYAIRNRVNVAPDDRRGRALLSISHGSYPDFIYKDPAYKYFMYYDDPEQPGYGTSLKNFTRIFWNRFKAEPARYLMWYLFGKPTAFWNWNIFQGQGDIYIYPVRWSLYTINPVANLTHDIMKGSHLFVLLFALLGGFFHLHKVLKEKIISNQTLYPLLIFVLLGYYTVIFIIFAPWPRYSIPLRPELYIGAMWTIYFLINFCGSRKYRKHFFH